MTKLVLSLPSIDYWILILKPFFIAQRYIHTLYLLSEKWGAVTSPQAHKPTVKVQLTDQWTGAWE